MNIDLNDAIVRLNADNNFQMRDARGACIHVHWGDLWITQEGDLKDHIVKTGESFEISKSGMTFLTAMSEAGVSVLEKCRESAIASAAVFSTVALPATQDEQTDARQSVAAVDGSIRDGARLENPYPDADEVNYHIGRAEILRAQYFADTARHFADAATRVWIALRRSMGALRQFG